MMPFAQSSGLSAMALLEKARKRLKTVTKE